MQENIERLREISDEIDELFTEAIDIVSGRSESIDSALVRLALAEKRVILTRDSHLVKRKLARKVLFIRSEHPREQFKQVAEELGLDVQSNLFTRCLICNQELNLVEKENIQHRVPSYTYLTQDKFYECPECERVYWPGTHKDNMLQVIDDMIV